MREHGRGGTIFFVRECDRPLNRCARQIIACDSEDEMDFCKDFRVCFGALSAEFDRTARDRVTAALEDQYDIVSGATTRTNEQELHWPWRKIVSPAFGCAIHRRDMTSAGLTDEEHAVRAAPINFDFHVQSPAFKQES